MSRYFAVHYMRKKIKVVQITAEIEPFSKSGGLANVMGSLPKTQAKLGCSVVVITPLYSDDITYGGQTLETVAENVEVEITRGIFEKVSFYKGVMPDSSVPIYFVSHKKYFGTPDNGKIYGKKNDNARFMVFCVAALQLLRIIRWKPDIIHCHDWHTGLIPYFLKGRYKNVPFWKNSASLFTIHNLVYQFGHDWWLIPENMRDDGRTALPVFDDTQSIERINFVKRAIINADTISTVSETYREEILTRDFGEELHRILKNREDIIYGIVNGINYDDYNPQTDPGLYVRYNNTTISRKKQNKAWLQKDFGLKKGPNIPVISMTSRIVEQKGFALLLEIIPTLIEMGVQLVIMGDGDETIISELTALQKNFPDSIAYTAFDTTKETSLYAGSDIFLLPSRFEPCGVNQMIALRYGSIPVVHHIGGLADTIENFNPRTQTGNGFTFFNYDSHSLLAALVRAIETYKHKKVWRKLMVSALKEANSWILPAKKYKELYKTVSKLGRANKRKRLK